MGSSPGNRLAPYVNMSCTISSNPYSFSVFILTIVTPSARGVGGPRTSRWVHGGRMRYSKDHCSPKPVSGHQQLASTDCGLDQVLLASIALVKLSNEQST